MTPLITQRGMIIADRNLRGANPRGIFVKPGKRFIIHSVFWAVRFSNGAELR